MNLQTLIQKASRLREQDKLEASLNLLNKIIFSAVFKNIPKIVVGALSERALVFKHCNEKTGVRLWLGLMKADVLAMLDITDDFNITEYKAIANFRMGEYYRHVNDWKQAVKSYKLALKYFKGSLSQKGDWRYHLGAAMYKAGHKEAGLKQIMFGITDIESGRKKISSFLYNVWLSGAYMQLADVLKRDDIKKARGYYARAKEIIFSDKRLVLRKQQLNRLKI